MNHVRTRTYIHVHGACKMWAWSMNRIRTYIHVHGACKMWAWSMNHGVNAVALSEVNRCGGTGTRASRRARGLCRGQCGRAHGRSIKVRVGVVARWS